MCHRLVILLTIAALSLTGCASFQDAKFKTTHCVRAHSAARQAPPAAQFNGDYKDGFVRGYYEYSLNRTCKAPSVPPKEYWKAKYQSPCGHQQIEAWYEGFEMGMLAAERDCGNCWHYFRPRGMTVCEKPYAYPLGESSPLLDELVPSEALDIPAPKLPPKMSPETILAPKKDAALFEPAPIDILPTAYEEQVSVQNFSVSPTAEPRQAPATLSSVHSRTKEESRAKKPLFDAPPLN